MMRAVTCLGLAAVYYAAGRLGLSLAFVHPTSTPVWPPTGIALAALLLFGLHFWPAILAGAFLLGFGTTSSVPAALAIAAGNTLEGVAGAGLVRRFARGSSAFERPHDVVRFVVLAGLASTAISATVGVTALRLGGFVSAADSGAVWITWWLGDAGGAVVVAPALVTWSQDQSLHGVRQRELLLLLGVALLLGLVVFSGTVPRAPTYPLAFLCLPVAAWSAFRFGPRETAAVMLLLAALSIWGTLRGGGPFPRDNRNESLLLLQAFMAVVAATALPLAAVVTEHRRALRDLERQALALVRSNADLQEFAHVVSHDLKAPLRGIAALAAFLTEDCAATLPATAQEHLRQLDQRVRRMGQLVDGVLAYCRVQDSGELPPLVDSRAVLDEALELIGPTGAVRVRVDGALPAVRFDRTQLLQVFQNLIGNAVQHLGRPSGEVVVSCRDRGSDCEFTVRDDGVGMPAAELARIFTTFARKEPYAGTAGIGLAIVKKIVELRGGEVAAASTPGGGATMTFTVLKAPQRARAGFPADPRSLA